MRQAELITAEKRITVTIAETAGGMMVISHQGKPIMAIRPVATAQSQQPQRSARAWAVDRKPVLTDLNGNPAHDWPLFVKRFQKTQPDILMAIAHVYKTKFAYSTPSIESLIRADEDLEAIMPILANIIDTDGELKRAHRARIAEQLGIKDAGNYRVRIDAVVSILLANLAELLENLQPVLGNSANSTAFQKPQKAANE